jgi:hypothetical protein
MADLNGRFVQLPGRMPLGAIRAVARGARRFCRDGSYPDVPPNGAAPEPVSIRSGAQKMAKPVLERWQHFVTFAAKAFSAGTGMPVSIFTRS